MIQQISQRDDGAAEGEQKRANQREISGILPFAAKPVGAHAGDQEMQDEERTAGGKEWQQQQ